MYVYPEFKRPGIITGCQNSSRVYGPQDKHSVKILIQWLQGMKQDLLCVSVTLLSLTHITHLEDILPRCLVKLPIYSFMLRIKVFAQAKFIITILVDRYLLMGSYRSLLKRYKPTKKRGHAVALFSSGDTIHISLMIYAASFVFNDTECMARINSMYDVSHLQSLLNLYRNYNFSLISHLVTLPLI